MLQNLSLFIKDSYNGNISNAESIIAAQNLFGFFALLEKIQQRILKEKSSNNS